MVTVNTRKQALQEKISDLEETLAQLKNQLNQEIEIEQHEAIDNLEVYLDQINNRFANLQGFWQLFREEISEVFSSTDKNKGA